MSAKLANRINSPHFATLLLDNFYTTAAYTGVIGALPGGAIGGMAGIFLLMPEVGAVIGGAITAIPTAIIGGALFSVPFAISAQSTRQFKPDSEINPFVTLFSRSVDNHDKQKIIDEIIRKDNELSYFTVRSIESYILMSELRKKPEDKMDKNGLLQSKWELLLKYMSAKSFGDAYTHNGKNIFNTILAVFNTTSKDTHFQLRHAILNDDLNEIDRLLAEDISLLTEDIFNGMSLLHYASLNNRAKTLNHILEEYQGKFVLDAIARGKTALQIAVELGHVDATLAIFARNRNAKVGPLALHPLHIAAANGHDRLVNALLGADPFPANTTDNDNQTPLMYAAKHGKLAVVEDLVFNWRVNHTIVANNQKNALQMAEENNHQHIANLLSEKGCPDPITEKLKIELTNLVRIVNSHLWEEKGWGLFCNHTPDRVIRLQQYIRNNSRLFVNGFENLNRKTIREIVFNFQSIVSYGEKRSGDQGELYKLIGNLGKNPEAAFESLLERFPTARPRARCGR